MPDASAMLSDLVLGSPTIVACEEEIARHHEMLVSTRVIGELREVVARKWPDRAPALEELVQAAGWEVVVTPEEPAGGLSDIRDPDDRPVLYSAVVADADVLVTGGKDFAGVGVERPETLTPAEYLGRCAGRDAAGR